MLKMILQHAGYGNKMKLKESKSGQMKIQQMAFMLIAVTLFFALVGLFVLGVFSSGLKNSATLLEEQNALLLVSRLSNSPEFSCGDAFGTSRVNCVDFDKVMALKSNMNDYTKARFWGDVGIEIVKVYAGSGGGITNVSCTPGNYPSCGKIEIVKASSGTGVSNFASLCRKQGKNHPVFNETGDVIGYIFRIGDECEIAKVVVTYKDAG